MAQRPKRRASNPFSTINPHAAGIDVGATHHVVAVAPDRDPSPVRTFCTFSGDLHALADWLHAVGITTVAMESTGVYWIPVFEILEARGFEVVLVNARDVKQVPGRKTDVNDAQWLQQLHQYGLLRGSFRPREAVVQLRAYLRLRERLIEYAAAHIQHMQKALMQMNLQLHHAVIDITGATGMRILRAIVADLSQIHGLGPYTVLRLIAECGDDMTRWPTAKHFTSWLCLAPANKISGGRVLSAATRRSSNRAAALLRIAAVNVGRTQTALGACYRRLAARIGKAQAVTATARKLAVLFYKALRFGMAYADPGVSAYEAKYRHRLVQHLERRAKSLGFTLVAKAG
jgi:transposase